MSPYYSPEKFGLILVTDIDTDDGYGFNMTVLWKRQDGTFVTASDSGCSCPSPFEDTGISDLEPVYSLADLRARIAAQHSSAGVSEVDDFLTQARNAGMR